MFSDRQIVLNLAGVFLVSLIASCGFVNDEKLIGPYRLAAVDDNHTPKNNCHG